MLQYLTCSILLPLLQNLVRVARNKIGFTIVFPIRSEIKAFNVIS